MQSRLSIYIISGLLLLAVLAVASLYMGVYVFQQHSLIDVFKGIVTDDNSIPAGDRFVLLDLRLPRVVMAMLIGSSLAVSGTCLQGMFRNALATPDLLGITAGASLFAAIAIVLGSYIKPYVPVAFQFSLLSFMAFAGALLTMIFVYRMSTTGGKTNVMVMLLTGVAVTALGFAIMGFLIYISKEEQLRDLTFWNLGSLGGATWTKNCTLAVIVAIGYSFLLNKGKALNAMMLGEKDAEHLGIRVERTKKQIIVFTALMVGVSVAFAGTISFVGLIVPYILRLIFRSNYHIVLPLSAILGGILLLTADTISRTLVPPSEIPIGILTAFMGAPIFMAILIKSRKSI